MGAVAVLAGLFLFTEVIPIFFIYEYRLVAKLIIVLVIKIILEISMV